MAQQEQLLLRLRLPLGDTYRLHVHPSSTVASVLEQAIVTAVSSYGETFDPSQLWLSLNKRDSLASADQTRVGSCTRRGDLVYLMGVQLEGDVRRALEAQFAATKQLAAAKKASAERAQSAAAAAATEGGAAASSTAETAAAEEDIMQQARLYPALFPSVFRQVSEKSTVGRTPPPPPPLPARRCCSRAKKRSGTSAAIWSRPSSFAAPCLPRCGTALRTSLPILTARRPQSWTGSGMRCVPRMTLRARPTPPQASLRERPTHAASAPRIDASQVGTHSGMSASPENVSDADGESSSPEKVQKGGHFRSDDDALNE